MGWFNEEKILSKIVSLLTALLLTVTANAGLKIDSVITKPSSCINNGSITIFAETTSGTILYAITGGPLTFPEQTSNVFSALPPGSYTIEIFTTSVEKLVTAAVVTGDSIFPELSKTGNSCIGGKVVLTYGASAYFSYTWTRPDGNLFSGDTLIISPVTAADTGIYTINRLSTVSGCTVAQSVTYRIAAGARDSMAVSICKGQIFHFGNKALTVPGVYIDTIPTGFCDSISILKLIITDVKKDSNVAAICKGQSYLFGNKLLTQTGIYRDTISTSSCDSISTLNLTVNSLPVIRALSDKLTVIKGETIQLSVSPSNLDTYVWAALNLISNSNINNPTSLVNVSSTYTVLVTDANNCTNADSLFVKVADSTIHTCSNHSVYIPTAFTPNNDGKNDFFKISGIDNFAYRGYRLMIYNRQGQKIFESIDPLQNWDGKYQGKPAATGSYVYYVRFICEDGRPFNQNGNILLLR